MGNPTDPMTTGGGTERPPRSDIPAAPEQTPPDAYAAWQAEQAAKAEVRSPADADPEYQAYLADKADRDRAAQMALLDPEYAQWKAGKDAEAERVAALGPSCPHCHQPVANPTGEALGYCWACGFGSTPDQADRYAEAVDQAEVPAS